MPPTISICIPCYRSERYIRTTIESALAQLVSPFEVLISDDNSPDRSYEIVQEYEGIPGVRIIRPQKRLTLGEHYRFVLERAGGDYVCFLSSDDALMPSFVGTMQDCFGGDPEIGMVAAGCLECDNSMMPQRLRGMGLPRKELLPPNGFRYFAEGCSYTISMAVLSRRLLLGTRPLPAGASVPTDWYWALLLGLQSKVKFLRQPLGYYRFHDANASHSATERWREEAQSMLRFLIETDGIDLERRRELEKSLRKIRIALAGTSEDVSFAKACRMRVKDLMKGCMALRYRSLPGFLAMAEQGTSVSLMRPKP